MNRFFGPKDFNVANDFVKDANRSIPNLKNEMSYFVNFKLEDLVDFMIFDKKREINIKGCIIRLLDNNDYEIIDPAKPDKPIVVPGEIEYKVSFDLGEMVSQPFAPPIFGVTCLGPSHGFDPENNTSGFVIWLNGRGIMIDPPVNSTEWMMRSNVNPQLIDSVILTHTHADHDAGTFQKILEERKITIYTTKTIMESWLRKYSTLTGMTNAEITQLFNFYPVMIGARTSIQGGWFDFYYSLHSLPTIGFHLSFRDKSFVYSSDHLNYTPVFDDLYKKKLISKERYKEFKSFPWDADIIYHESGFPPLHTPIDYLNSLSSDLQKKIVVYHIAKKDFPSENTDLTLARFGIGSTLVFDVEKSQYEEAYHLLDVLCRVDIFKDFNVQKVKDILSVIKKIKIKKGDHIIKKGTQGDTFYIIIAGSTKVVGEISNNSNGGKMIKRFGNYQYFGEVSLLLNTKRTIDVYAETDVDALTISKPAFLNLIKGSKVEEKLKRIALNRDKDSWDALSASEVFNKLTYSQKTSLEVILERVEINKKTTLINKGEQLKHIYIFHSGKAYIYREDDVYYHPKKGDFIGKYNEFNLDLPSSISCVLEPKSLLFKLDAAGFKEYIAENPGIYLRFFEAFEQ